MTESEYFDSLLFLADLLKGGSLRIMSLILGWPNISSNNVIWEIYYLSRFSRISFRNPSNALQNEPPKQKKFSQLSGATDLKYA